MKQDPHPCMSLFGYKPATTFCIDSVLLLAAFKHFFFIIYIFFCLKSVFFSIECQSVNQSITVSVCLRVCLSFCLCLSLCVSVCLSVCFSCLSVCLTLPPLSAAALILRLPPPPPLSPQFFLLVIISFLFSQTIQEKFSVSNFSLSHV